MSRPPPPAAVTCATCGITEEWIWEPDLPAGQDSGLSGTPGGYYEVDSEWYGVEFHCSRVCYVTGEEYAAESAARRDFAPGHS